jgi:hypothetical protein
MATPYRYRRRRSILRLLFWVEAHGRAQHKGDTRTWRGKGWLVMHHPAAPGLTESIMVVHTRKKHPTIRHYRLRIERPRQ